VATIGPTSEQLPKLQQVVKAGMRIMRLNFSHATDDEVELRVTNLKKCQGRHAHLMEEGDKNIRAILLDTKGPEIRTGKLRGDTSGKETISLAVGNTITLHTDTRWADTGSTVVRPEVNGFRFILHSF
jgi:pyruvate kinase